MVGFTLLTALIFWIWAIITAATHLVLTIVVYRDAKTLYEPALGIKPSLWATIAFTLPLGGMFIYWLINHSTLNKMNSRY